MGTTGVIDSNFLEPTNVFCCSITVASQQLRLSFALGNRAICPNNPVPGKILVRRGKDSAHEARRFGIDVAIGLHVADWNLSDSLNNAILARPSIRRPCLPHRPNVSLR